MTENHGVVSFFVSPWTLPLLACGVCLVVALTVTADHAAVNDNDEYDCDRHERRLLGSTNEILRKEAISTTADDEEACKPPPSPQIREAVLTPWAQLPINASRGEALAPAHAAVLDEDWRANVEAALTLHESPLIQVPRCSPAASKAHPALREDRSGSSNRSSQQSLPPPSSSQQQQQRLLRRHPLNLPSHSPRRPRRRTPGPGAYDPFEPRERRRVLKEFAHIGPTKHMHIRRDSSQRVLAYSLMLSPSHSPAGGEEARPSTRSYASSCGASCISSPSAAYSSERSHRWSGEHGGERLPFGYLPRSGEQRAARIFDMAGERLGYWGDCRALPLRAQGRRFRCGETVVDEEARLAKARAAEEREGVAACVQPYTPHRRHSLHWALY